MSSILSRRELLRTLSRAERSYLECALWSSTLPDTNGEPLDSRYGLEDLSLQAIGTARLDVERFLERFSEELERSGADTEQVGHDLWLTRNGHGTGFWCRDDEDYPPDVRGALSAGARELGELDLYPGDDGLLYMAGGTAL